MEESLKLKRQKFKRGNSCPAIHFPDKNSEDEISPQEDSSHKPLHPDDVSMKQCMTSSHHAPDNAIPVPQTVPQTRKSESLNLQPSEVKLNTWSGEPSSCPEKGSFCMKCLTNKPDENLPGLKVRRSNSINSSILFRKSNESANLTGVREVAGFSDEALNNCLQKYAAVEQALDENGRPSFNSKFLSWLKKPGKVQDRLANSGLEDNLTPSRVSRMRNMSTEDSERSETVSLVEFPDVFKRSGKTANSSCFQEAVGVEKLSEMKKISRLSDRLTSVGGVSDRVTGPRESEEGCEDKRSRGQIPADDVVFLGGRFFSKMSTGGRKGQAGDLRSYSFDCVDR